MEISRLDRTKLAYTFYYYDSNGTFKVNPNSFMVYGLMIDACLLIMSVDQFFIKGEYTSLIITTVIFAVMLLLIRGFNGAK